MSRSMSIGPQDVFLLDQWGRQIKEAFGDWPYLVGSVARAVENWRDVDVRVLIEDETVWNAISDPPARLWAINTALSLWGRQVTGLPIDFQFQCSAEFHRYDSEIRNPMGPRSRAGWRLWSACSLESK